MFGVFTYFLKKKKNTQKRKRALFGEDDIK